MTEHDDLHLFTGAYALGALSPEEKAEFEAYLAESEEARTEVAGMSSTAVLLGMASRPVAPSPDLKARLMAQLASTPQFGADQSDSQLSEPLGLVDAPRVTPVAVPSDEADAAPTRAEARARSTWFQRPAAVLVAVAAAAALFFVGAVTGLSASNVGDAQAVSFTELATAADVEQAVAAVAGGGNATLLYSKELRRSAVMIDTLPALDEGKVFQLWYIDASGATPAGILNPSESGRTMRVLDGALDEKDIVGITIEPAGGSEKPTTDPIAVIESA